MSKKQIFLIRDDLTKSYGPPIFHENKGTLIRELTKVLASADNQSLICTNPENFSVFEAGTYDATQGKFALLDNAQHVFNMVDIKS